MSKIFEYWRARVAPACAPRPDTTIFGKVFPYSPELEAIAARYNVWRKGPDDDDRSVAHRAAIAICESIGRQEQITAALQRDLDIILAYDRVPPCEW